MNCHRYSQYHRVELSPNDLEKVRGLASDRDLEAKYLLIDSWFTMPATVISLAQHIKVIGMAKKSSRIHYRFNGQALDLMAIYRDAIITTALQCVGFVKKCTNLQSLKLDPEI